MPSIDTQLGSAVNFAVLASSTVTNSGPTVIIGGNLGLFPGSSVTGFPPGIVVPPAVQHVTDAIANQAELDAMTAYNGFQAMSGATPIVGNLAGQTLPPGLYSAASSMDLSVGGTLILDAGGNANATFIFKMGSTLTINVGASVLLVNGAQAKNVVWAVGSSATVNTSAVMVGDIIALASVSLGTGASLNGRAIGLTGAVTLLSNAITMPSSAAPVVLTSVNASITLSNLSEICFPDITGKVIRAWGLLTITPGGYVAGGLVMGLIPFADVRTVDFNGFLNAEVYGEEPVNEGAGNHYTFHYSPVGDVLQIFNNGVELVANQVIPASILADTLLFQAQWDRTSVRG